MCTNNNNITCVSSLPMSEDGLRTPDLEVMCSCCPPCVCMKLTNIMWKMNKSFPLLSLLSPTLCCLFMINHLYDYYFHLSICNYSGMLSLLIINAKV